MATPVYSASFFSVPEATGRDVLTVPDGQVWILRDIDMWSNGGLAGAEIFFFGSSDQIFWDRVSDGSKGDSWFQWHGRIVFTPGQTWGSQVLAGTWGITAGGYILTLP